MYPQPLMHIRLSNVFQKPCRKQKAPARQDSSKNGNPILAGGLSCCDLVQHTGFIQTNDLATDLRSLFHLNRSVVMLGYVIWFIRMRILRAPSWVRRHQGEYAAGLFCA